MTTSSQTATAKHGPVGSPDVLTQAVIVSSCYVAFQLIANVASLRIVRVGWSVDAGTLVYPFVFTLRDLVHRAGGRALARRVVLVAAALNLIMAVIFQIAAWLPLDPAGGSQSAHFAEVLGPVWRIVGASIAAGTVAELVDTEVYHRWARRFGEHQIWQRVLVSNAVSIPTDSVLFATLAFAGVLPADVWVQIVGVNVVVKVAVTLCSLPSIYAVRRGPTGE